MPEDHSNPEAPQPELGKDFRPKEPLHSLLLESPVEALKFLHDNLHDYQSEAEMSDYFAEVGLQRREFIQQLQYVMGLRKLHF